MKKNILFVLSVLVLSISFIACSKDDDNNDTSSNIGTVNLYIDDNKINTNSIAGEGANSIHYDEASISFPRSNMSMMIMWGDGSESAFFHFDGINLKTLKVGDDLVKLCTDYNYQVSYGRNAYWLDSKIDWYDEFADGKGKFIVRELNADKTVINIEFQDLNIPILKGLKPDKSKMIKIKGNMKYSIDF